MVQGSWLLQVETQVGRALTPDELAGANRDFAAMAPAFRANDYYVLDFVQHVVRTCRDNERYDGRLRQICADMDDQLKVRVDESAAEMRAEISLAVKAAFVRLQSASPNIQQARRRTAYWAAALFSAATVFAFGLLTIAQQRDLIPTPGITDYQKRAMLEGDYFIQSGQLLVAYWAARNIPDLAMTKDLDPVVGALKKCRSGSNGAREKLRCSRRYTSK